MKSSAGEEVSFPPPHPWLLFDKEQNPAGRWGDHEVKETCRGRKQRQDKWAHARQKHFGSKPPLALTCWEQSGLTAHRGEESGCLNSGGWLGVDWILGMEWGKGGSGPWIAAALIKLALLRQPSWWELRWTWDLWQVRKAKLMGSAVMSLLRARVWRKRISAPRALPTRPCS